MRFQSRPVSSIALYFFGMFYLFPRVPLWVMIILGLIYSVSISWNINGISHNFIHNPYFRVPNAESLVQHFGINHGRLQPDLL